MAQPVLSPLQLLPLHVVTLIVDHVVGSSRLVYDDVRSDSRKYRELLKPLLSVSHNFRKIALSYFWKSIDVDLTTMGLGHLRGHGYPTDDLAKDVTVILDERNVFSGKALDRISRMPYGNGVFLRARTVKFHFVEDYMDGNKSIAIDLSRADVNICAFVERIKRMAPLVSEIKVELAGRDDFPSKINQPFSDLVSQLYQLVSRIDYYHSSGEPDLLHLRLDATNYLSHINYSSESDVDDADEFVWLAKTNAMTLQSLIIKSEGDIDVLGLVHDTDGCHLTYPHLIALTLSTLKGDDELHRPTFQGAAPFPVLRRLDISLSCPFDDDTFFRGNAATLEQLTFELDSKNVSMLRKYQVFAPDSHPKLQAVQLHFSWDLRVESFTSPAEAMEFVHNIGSGATVRGYTTQPGFDILLSLDDHACIQVLSLQDMRFGLWVVFNLIKSLPLLSDLHTTMPHLGPMPDGVTMDTLPEYVVSKYAPMGKRLRCWHLNSIYSRQCDDLETCVLLLALVCPNFDYAALP
ncbi:hypothetical protein GGI18_002646, partial [Coemansia linderi]